MSGLTGGLVPLGGGSSRTSSAKAASSYDDDEFGVADVDDFDTLFNDMLDKPTPKSKGGKKSSSKSSSSGGGGGGKKKKFDVEASLESFGSPSSNYSPETPTFSGSSRPHANSPDDSDDGNGGAGVYGGSSENLEDSILGKLGGTKSSGTTNNKKASKPDTVASTAARTSGFVHNARSIDTTSGLGKGGMTASTTSSMQYSDHHEQEGVGEGDEPDQDDLNDFDLDDVELPDMGGYQPSVASSYSTVSARPPSSSLPSSSATATNKGNTTSWGSSGGQNTTNNNYNSYDSNAGMSTNDEPSSGGAGGGGGDGDLGFIPSFYEPGRQTRQRRILGTTSTSAGSKGSMGVKSSGHLDELDAMLGFGSGAGSVRGKAVDPFGNTRYRILLPR